MVTQYQFEQLITRLEDAIKFYKTTPYRYNENRLYLSNGKILDFMFQKHYIPHLLGINIGNLKTSKVLLSDKPLEMTEELIQRYTAIYQKMQRGELKYDDIFSPYIEKKLTVFTNVLKLNFSDIVCACHHVPGRAYVAGKMEGYGCEYYIMLDDGKKSPYFLGLKKEKGITDYCPSSILYDLSSDSQIPKMLTNQQIMLVNCLEYLNSGKTEIFNLSEKL